MGRKEAGEAWGWRGGDLSDRGRDGAGYMQPFRTRIVKDEAGR